MHNGTGLGQSDLDLILLSWASISSSVQWAKSQFVHFIELL